MVTVDRDPYERALCDHAFLDRVQGRYRGSYEVTDALWWLAHPKECSPNGVKSPTLQIRRLESLIYSKGSEEKSRAQWAIELDKVRLELARERELIRAAVEDSQALKPLTEPSVSDKVGPPLESAGRGSPTGTTSRWLALAVVIAVGIGAVSVQSVREDITASRAAMESAASIANPASPGAFAEDPTQALMSRFPLPKDAVAIDDATSLLVAGSGVDPSSLIGLSVPTPYSVPSLNRVYVARDTKGSFCLVAISSGGQVSTACNEMAAVEASGLKLAWTTTDYVDSPNTPRAVVMTAELSPLGSVRIVRVRPPE